jgi:hypothetical protein
MTRTTSRDLDTAYGAREGRRTLRYHHTDSSDCTEVHLEAARCSLVSIALHMVYGTT